jgi:predicted nuclease of predicted toxin-antitoxin system
VRFLLHGNLNPSLKAAVERHGHKAFAPTEVEIPPDADAAAVMTAAHVKQLDILTNDREFALFARTTALKFDRSIVYLQLAGEEIEQDDAVDRLFARYKAPKPRQMYTVTETRVKVLQLKSI